MNIKPIASSSKGNAYLVGDGKTNILLDCGVGIDEIRRAVGVDLGSPKGCLVTHCHKDHSRASKELLKQGIPVYMSRGTKEACGLENAATVHSIERFLIGTFEVMPFDVQHDAPEPLGFLIRSRITGETLVYFTDTYYVKYMFPNINYILGECNYSIDIIRRRVESSELDEGLVKRIIKSHMSLEHFIEFLRANDLSHLKKIYLIHLSDGNSDEKAFKEAVQRETGKEVIIC